ncbi:phage N-6-adenine-methyltransferase [bacterium]|nr:phage N-6-adenine-methyltransferase [bacterium]
MSNAYYNKAETVEWGTPQRFFDNMNKRLGPFTLDAAASELNHKCEDYFTEENDALSQNWATDSPYGEKIVWCNPPYGHGVGKWVQKAVEEVKAGHCKRVVMLLRSTTDVKWFHDWAWPYCSEMIFVKGRMCFDKGDGEEKPAVFPSIVLVFDRAFFGMHTAPTISRVDKNGEEIE